MIPVDKPAGMTSHDVVQRFRRMLGLRRIGHGGTLDPAATGLLVLFIGRATRLIQYMSGDRKVYEVRILFGRATSTDDAEGETTNEGAVPDLSVDAWRESGRAFVGEIDQVPPKVSAVHHEGKRAYQRARRGEDFELPARRVRIHEIDVVSWSAPILTARVACGSGVYIRSLARDWGIALGTCAHVVELRRTAVGPFSVDGALAMGAAEEFAEQGTLADRVLDPSDALIRSVGRVIELTSAEVVQFCHGMRVACEPGRIPSESDGPIVVMNTDGALIGLAKVAEAETLAPLLVWAGPTQSASDEARNEAP